MKTQNQQNKNIPVHRSKIDPINFRPLKSLQQNIDRLFDNYFLPDLTNWVTFPTLLELDSDAAFAPPAEITESEKEYLLRMDVPGIAQKDIHVEVRSNSLIVSGERKEEREENNKGRRFTECSYGSFCRTFPLPSNVNTDQIQANCNGGILQIALPKTEATQAKTIPVGEKN